MQRPILSTRFTTCLAAILFSILQTSVFAADPWILTTADFHSQRAGLLSMSADQIAVHTSTADSQTVAMDQFLSLDRAESVPTMPSKFFAILAGGDKAAGQPKRIDGNDLVWQGPLMGEIKLPLRSLLGITSADHPELPAEPAGAARMEDQIVLANGDKLHGIIASIDTKTITIQQPGAESSPVPVDTIRRILFAAVGPTPTVAREHGFLLKLADGSSLTVGSLQVSQDRLTATLRDGTSHNVPIDAVDSIEQVDGPITWLSAMTPTESVSQALLSLTWTPHMDRSVDGEPIRFGEQTFSRGIGVHAYSRMSWEIDSKWQAFRTQYAIAGDWPYANVTVRIKLDDQVVHEQKDVRSGSLAAPVVLETAGHKKLTLEVDYGENYDVQDRLNWIEPAFLNYIPKPAAPK